MNSQNEQSSDLNAEQSETREKRTERFNRQVHDRLLAISQGQKKERNELLQIISSPVKANVRRFVRMSGKKSTLYDEDDLFQEVCIHICNQAHTYNPEKGDKPFSWILTIALRKCIDLFRPRKNQYKPGTLGLDDLASLPALGNHETYVGLVQAINLAGSKAGPYQSLRQTILSHMVMERPLSAICGLEPSWTKYRVYAEAESLVHQLHLSINGE